MEPRRGTHKGIYTYLHIFICICICVYNRDYIGSKIPRSLQTTSKLQGLWGRIQYEQSMLLLFGSGGFPVTPGKPGGHEFKDLPNLLVLSRE